MGDGVSTNITICTLQHEGGKLSAVKHTDIRNHWAIIHSSDIFVWPSSAFVFNALLEMLQSS